MSTVVPTIPDGQMAIIALTTDPNGTLATADALAGRVFCPGGGNALSIFGKATAAGSLVLMRNLGTGSTEWYPVDLDSRGNKELAVDNTKPVGVLAGQFAGTWLTGDLKRSSTACYVVVALGGATFSKLYVAERGI